MRRHLLLASVMGAGLLAAAALAAPARFELFPIPGGEGGVRAAIAEDQARLAARPDDPTAELEIAIGWHSLAALGVEDASHEADARFEALLEKRPGDAEILAYLGSAKTMLARDTWFLPAKLTRVNRGIELMDQAAALAPDNLRVRGVRASNGLRLPPSFDRKPLALADLEAMAAILHRQPETDQPGLLDRVLTQLVIVAGETGDRVRQQRAFQELQARAAAPELVRLAEASLLR